MSEISVPNSRLRYYQSFYVKHPILEPGPRKAPRPGGRGRASKRHFFCMIGVVGKKPGKRLPDDVGEQGVFSSKCSGPGGSGMAEAVLGEWGALAFLWSGGEGRVSGPR